MDLSPPDGRTTIDVKILSPSPEVGTGGLQLKNIAVNTTIGALKAAIAESIPSHPGPERQRLIYLGRALARDDDQLLTVFGRETIQNDSNHTLHLVLREAIRPASVPPHPSNPFRTTITNPPASTNPTPVQRNPFTPPQEQTPQQQPPPQPQGAQGANPLTHVLANANIRATSNGVPINLPPEVINQLLNQRLAQEGSFNFLQNMQPRGQPQTQPPSQPTSAPNSNPSPEGPSPLQQHWAQQQAALAANFAAAAPMARQDSEPPGNRGRERSTHRHPPSHPTSPGAPPRRASDPDQPTSGTATPAVPIPGTSGSPAPNGPHQPHSHTIVRAGINPDGTRWQTTTVQYDGPHHHLHNHPQNHAPGQLPPGQLPFPIPPQLGQMPMQLPGQIPLMQPLPRMPPQFPLQAMNQAMHLRMGTPPTGGLGPRPGTTPRSISPARSVSGEGPRRVGTPAAELQHRLSETMREVRNVNTLLGVMATGNLATGGPAPPLSEVEREQLRVTAHNMNQHIEGFGADLASLINGHPNMWTDPDFAVLNSQYQLLQAQGRAIRHQVGTLTGTASNSSPRNGDGPADILNNPSQESSPIRSQITSAIAPTVPTMGDQPLIPNATTSAPAPELHVLNDASGIPQALLVGPTGQFVTPTLSPAVMNALVAAQLPYDQLVQQFTRGVGQLINNNNPQATVGGNAQLIQALNTFAIARQRGQAGIDDEAVIQRMNYILGQERGRRDARRIRRRNPGQPDTHAAGANPGVVLVGGDGAVPGQAQQLAVAPNQPQLQQQIARGGNNEVRDMLAPIVRNLWLAARLAAFAYFFLSSGRGYWRVLLLGGIGLAIYALNSGWLGRNVDNAWESLRRHFETLVNDARRGNPIAPTAAQMAYNNAHPTPEDTARRLLQEHQRRNRSATQEFIDRAVARARQAERTFALFVASLWPGVGEGVIRAQEQARREEEQRIEEERKTREEEEAKKNEEAKAKKAAEEGNAGEGSSKEVSTVPVPLPEQTTVAQDEAFASGSNIHGEATRVNVGKDES
ncbi:hypothetical protein EG327_010319 [Venturia inaequalis]|uniref:Ubiquitin-like domain-containing protein n=2 Tax=Venturia inaequalis TaxID=5025 RepID=A0A8H3YUD0_VENIN|nr:hypothetical protein EG327_010319 [Venturia inaequalis]